MSEAVKHQPICAGCGMILHFDDVEEYLLCQVCLQQLNGQRVSWSEMEECGNDSR